MTSWASQKGGGCSRLSTASNRRTDPCPYTAAGGTRRVIGERPIKQLLIDARSYWDHEGTPSHVRETFLKMIKCGTTALGAEVYASEAESKLLFHTCKSRFCTSCGHRSTEAWQEDLEAVLPDVPYVGITLTTPREFRTILQQKPHILHNIPPWAPRPYNSGQRLATACA